MARPLYSVNEFNNKMEEFIKHCETEDIIPTDYQVIKFFKISPRTLDRYYSGMNDDIFDEVNTDNDCNNKETEKVNYKAFGESIKKLVMYREDQANRQAREDPKTIGNVNFRLKQGRWGGYSDRQESKSDMTIKVELGFDRSKAE